MLTFVVVVAGVVVVVHCYEAGLSSVLSLFSLGQKLYPGSQRHLNLSNLKEKVQNECMVKNYSTKS